VTNYFLRLAFVLTTITAISGCGGSGSNTNVGENADAKAMADYEAAVKASEEAMSSSTPK